MKESSLPEPDNFILTDTEAATGMQKQEELEAEKIYNDRNWRNFKEIELSADELETIEKKIKNSEGTIQKSLQEFQVAAKGLNVSICVSILFIIICLMVIDAEAISGLSQFAIMKYEQTTWGDSLYLQDVQTLDDLDAYIRTLYFPETYLDRELNFTVFFVGSRMTLHKYKSVENNIPEYRPLIPQIVEPSIGFDSINGYSVKTTDLSIWPYVAGEGHLNRGGYIEYFLNEDLEQSIERWRMMKPFWMQDDFANLIIETMFHDRNLGITILYEMNFLKGPAGYFDIITTCSGVLIESLKEITSEKFITIITLLILHIIGLLFQIYTFTPILIRNLKSFFTSLKHDLQFFEILEIINLFLYLSVWIIFINLNYLIKGSLSLPFTQFDFDLVIDYFYLFLTFKRLVAFMCVLITIKLTVILKSKFPSFGVLFDTIREAKTDIINFSAISVMLLLGFVLMGKLCFGLNHSQFKNIQGGFNALFITILSSVNYSDLKQANKNIAPIFTIVYCMLFYAVLLNMFIAIVISNYMTIKHRSQLILEAKAEMIKNESKKLIKTLIDLMFFRIKNTLKEDGEEYLKLTSVENYKNHAENHERIKILELSILQQYHKNYYAIFQYNLGQLQLILKTGYLKTNEQVKEEIQNVIRKIFVQRRKSQLEKKRLELNKYYNFTLVKNMCIFLMFTCVILVVLLARLRTLDSSKLIEIAHNLIDEAKVEAIVDETAVYDYIETHLIPILSETQLYSFNYVVKDPIFRMTIRKYKLTENKSKFSKDVTSDFIARNSDIFTENIRGNYTKMLYTYIDAGNKLSHDQQGGFILEFKSNTEINRFMHQIRADKLASKLYKSIAIEWILYNNNFDMFLYCSLVLVNTRSGTIESEIYAYPVDLEMFSDKYIYVGIFEAIFFCFIAYFLYIETSSWLEFWKKLQAERLMKIRGEKITQEIIISLEGQRIEKGCGYIWRVITKSIISFFTWLLSIIVQLMVSFYEYATSELYVLFDLIGDGLSMGILITILKLYANDFVHDFKINNGEIDFIGEFQVIVKLLENYRSLSAFLVFITFFRMLQFLRFNKNLSILTDVLSAAKIDILFFLAMFLVILFGYALMGYILLGELLEEYKSFPYSLINCYLMLLGTFDIDQISAADKTLGLFYFSSFIVLFYLLLLNMFTAIVGAYHREFELESRDENNIGFAKKVWMVIQAVLCKKPHKEKDLLAERNNLILSLKRENADKENIIQEFDIGNPHLVKIFESPSSWYSTMEKILFKLSGKKLILSKMPYVHLKKTEVSRNAPLRETVFLTIYQWESSNVEEKLLIWKSLTSAYQQNLHLLEERAMILQEEVPDGFVLKDNIEAMWKSTSLAERVELWAGKTHFGDFDRLLVWNSIAFLPSTLGLEDSNDWNVKKENDYWVDLNMNQKLELAIKICEPLKKFRQELKNSKNKNLKELFDLRYSELGFKELLWVTLSLNEVWKLSLFINNPDEAQAELIAFLLLAERKDSIFSLENSDSILSEMLDTCIHEKIVASCYLLAENNKLKGIKERIEEDDYDIRNLYEYKEKLSDDVQSYKSVNSKLLHEYNTYSTLMRKASVKKKK